MRKYINYIKITLNMILNRFNTYIVIILYNLYNKKVI
jgi:hypothetical protein